MFFITFRILFIKFVCTTFFNLAESETLTGCWFRENRTEDICLDANATCIKNLDSDLSTVGICTCQHHYYLANSSKCEPFGKKNGLLCNEHSANFFFNVYINIDEKCITDVLSFACQHRNCSL